MKDIVDAHRARRSFLTLLVRYGPRRLQSSFLDGLVARILCADSHTKSPALDVMSLLFAYFGCRSSVCFNFTYVSHNRSTKLSADRSVCVFTGAM